jgi:hypothetical protein
MGVKHKSSQGWMVRTLNVEASEAAVVKGHRQSQHGMVRAVRVALILAVDVLLMAYSRGTWSTRKSKGDRGNTTFYLKYGRHRQRVQECWQGDKAVRNRMNSGDPG